MRLDSAGAQGGGATASAADAAERVRRVAWTFATPAEAAALLPSRGTPASGGLIRACVDALGQHQGLPPRNGRRMRMFFVSDKIVVACGTRCASNPFETSIPETLGPCHLVAGGGTASRVVSWPRA